MFWRKRVGAGGRDYEIEELISKISAMTDYY